MANTNNNNSETDRLKAQLEKAIEHTTELKKALVAEEEKLRLLITEARGYALCCFQFHGDLLNTKVEFVSPSATDITGISDPYQFSNWLKHIHPEDTLQIDGVLKSVDSHQPMDVNFRLLHPEKQEDLWIGITGTAEPDFLDGSTRVTGIITDVSKQVRLEHSSISAQQRADNLQMELQDANIALSAVVNNLKSQAKKRENQIGFSLEQNVLSHLTHLKTTRLTEHQMALVEILETNVNNITAGLDRQMDEWRSKLSPTETQVADLIKIGKTADEIAELQSISTHTVFYHRKSIRRKLGLTSTKMNLRTFLNRSADDVMDK